MKKENKKAAASTPKFNIKDYPQIEWPNKKTGKVDKYYILPDDIFEEHLKELPNGTFNESKQYRAFNGGKLYQIGSNPEKDKEITRKGAEASNATQAQRRTSKEILEQLATRKADPEELDRLGLEHGTENLEAANYAAYLQAFRGKTSALTYIRDTLGEKPTETIDLNADMKMTDAERSLLHNVNARLLD